ncbi:MAG: right-handed parallel beta-helix repeat-containing protein, partial [Bacteroidales bacterium]
MINQKFKQFLIVLFLIALCFPLFSFKIWVSPDGCDTNPGTEEKPVATILMAQRKAREMRRLNDPLVSNGITIILKGGTYHLTEPVIIRSEDAGTGTSPTTFKAAPGETPVLSGGIALLNWKMVEKPIQGLPSNARGKVWIAELPKPGGQAIMFRQMWVNGKKATRASTLNDGLLPRILSKDNAAQSFMIPSPKFNLENIEGLEFVIHQWWAIAMLRVKKIENIGDSSRITFHQPESRIEFEHPWPAPFIDSEKNLNGNSAYYFVNSIALLNHPGEWYADFTGGKVYYWPQDNEDMQQAKVVIPCLETIVKIEGEKDYPVSYINFNGIRFQHSTWLRPSREGHVPLQAGWSITDAYKLKIPGTPDKSGLENQAWIERQSAGITVENAHHLVFEQCSFTNMAATGLDFISGTHHNLVQGCIFKDIGGTAIQMGFFGSPSFEAHLPYNPSDERELCRFETISNNLITDCTNEDWGCVGISVGFAHDINISHNELSHLNYSGICIGWGWTKTITCMKNNMIHANYIHHFAKNMYDVGGIYTLSAQP